MVKSDYGFGARLIHHLALNSKIIPEMSFVIDKMLHGTDARSFISQKHIFISGLARAGTTALMRLFHETGEFCSLTYRDMPFPLAPYLWRKIANLGYSDESFRERAHGDGILVNVDSPEALEEVFWRVFCGNKYILSDRLLPMKAGSGTIDNFRKYISGLLATTGSNRYLSKNNNNILRLSSIKKAFPDSIILIPFRDPIQQSLSMYIQHKRFVRVHHEDKFARNYMRWLVHHEFGGDHRFFDLDNTASNYSHDRPAYWLDQWIRAYRYLLKKQTQNRDLAMLFVEYEELCDNSKDVWEVLARHASLPEALPPGFVLSKAAEHDVFQVDGEVKDEAYRIYTELRELFTRTLYN